MRGHSLFSCFDVPAHLLMRGHPQKVPTASHENRSYPRLLDFATGLEEVPETPLPWIVCTFTHPAIRSCIKCSVPKIGDVQRTLSGISARSAGSRNSQVRIYSWTKSDGVPCRFSLAPEPRPLYHARDQVFREQTGGRQGAPDGSKGEAALFWCQHCSGNSIVLVP
jgi:hypothetical protein